MMRTLALALCVLALTSSAFAQPKSAPAYLIAEYEVLDADSMKKFGEAAGPIIKAHGGQYIARRSKIAPAIGEAPKTVTIVMFESLEKAQAYFQSPEYKAIIPLRDKGAKFRSYIVEAVDNPTP
jgi:uncharacterized protein (DUF1330 family)